MENIKKNQYKPGDLIQISYYPNKIVLVVSCPPKWSQLFELYCPLINDYAEKQLDFYNLVWLSDKIKY